MSLLALRVERVREREQASPQLANGALMQRAAAALATVCLTELRAIFGTVPGARVVLLVGSGDNGGDAMFAGARLARRGVRVDALLVSDNCHGDALSQLRRAGGRVHHCRDDRLLALAELMGAADLIVDGVLGIGGQGPLREPSAFLVAVVEQTGIPVIACDVPSGVDADSGAVPGAAIQATVTVTMGVAKPGLFVDPGASRVGRLHVVDLALPALALRDADAILVEDLDCAEVVVEPLRHDNKYRRAVVGVVAGSDLYPGAAVLSTGAARHGTAGYVRFVGAAAREVRAAWPEVVTTQDLASAGRAQCWVVGPGLGTDAHATRLVAQVLATDVPVVLDADALTLLAASPALKEAVFTRTAATVLTPHEGEFARLGGTDVSQDRIAAVRRIACDLRATVLLKGATTVVCAATGPAYVSASGTGALATAGSGDVLSGFLGSLLATAHLRGEVGIVPTAAVAAHVHGRAGWIAAAGGRSVAASDIAAALPETVARLRRLAAGMIEPW